MKNPICAASYERAVELIAAGCPIDYLDDLPRPLRAEQLSGCRVYALGPLEAGYVIALRLRTDRPSGSSIKNWRFKPPWPGQDINWDWQPEDLIPKEHLDEYKPLFKSPLMKVLDEGRKISCGHPVEGILCGRSYQPIGQSSHGMISAELSFTDAQGITVRLPINPTVYRVRHASADRLSVREAGRGVLGGLADSGRRSDLGLFLEALKEEEQVQAQTQSGVECALQTGKSERGDGVIPAGPVSESVSRPGDAATRQGS